MTTKHQQLLKTAAPFLLFLTLFIPEMAWASAAPWETAASKIQSIMGGNLAKIVATIAVMWLGYSWFTGRMEAGTAIKVAAGIIIIFSAPAIVNMLSSAASG